MKIMLRYTLYTLITLSLFSSYCYSFSSEDFKNRAKSIYLLHSLDNIKQLKKKPSALHLKADYNHFNMLSYIPGASPFLPYKDITTIVERIDSLTKELENSHGGERAQRIKFDLAYEYFLIYLHYLQEKYGLTNANKYAASDEIPINDKELLQYISLAEHYLKPFVSAASEKSDVFVRGKNLFRATDDVSFRFRNNPLYLNVYFLAMMIEYEKTAGNWKTGPKSKTNQTRFDDKSWYWLDSLWKKKQRSSASSKNVLTTETLFNLYELYFRYHFLGRYLKHSMKKDPLRDSQTQTLLKRLYRLAPKEKVQIKRFYKYYKNESTKDIGNTNFLVYLYLARRGYFITRDLDLPLPKRELFELYKTLYDEAAKAIKFNIPYRSNIYNELVIFGIGINNLRLMEDVLYNYADRSMLIPQNDNDANTRIKDSSYLTMAYLLANILDKKRRSGLDTDSDKYRDTAESLSKMLITKETDYWQYASIIQGALAVFYSRDSGQYNESLAMYHARKAFLAPCKKLELTYGKKGWEKFNSLPGAADYVEIFKYFRRKYPTSPYSAIPNKYNAVKILKLNNNKGESR